MSIKKDCIKYLHDNVLVVSKKYSRILKEINKLSLEIEQSVKDYYLSGISKREFEILKIFGDYWSYFSHRPGQYYYKHPKMTRELVHYFPKIKCFTIKVPKKRYSGKHPEELDKKINEIDDKIINLGMVLAEAERNWDNLINTNTKRTFLKKEFPELYKTLKDYEKAVSN